VNDLCNQRLGDFEVGREIGRGGMGVVYAARQISLHRKVALKVLSGGLGLTPKAVQRFHREAEAAGKLLAIQRGETEAAIANLEHAVELSPQNAAARGLLSRAYGWNGRYRDYGQSLGILAFCYA
jgi:hypothetical protein